MGELSGHADNETSKIDGFKVVFQDGYWGFVFGGLGGLPDEVIREHGPVIRAEPVDCQGGEA